MAWYVNVNGESLGPADEEQVVTWIREGRFITGLICEAGATEWRDLNSHQPFSLAVKAVAPPPPTLDRSDKTRRQETPIGHALLWSPFVATILIWMSADSALQPLVLWVLVAATVTSTAVLVWIESNRLQMGELPVENGKLGNGPIAWTFVALGFWVLAFPLFMRKRHWYGRPSRGLAAVAITAFFWLSIAIVGSVVDARSRAGIAPYSDTMNPVRY